MKKHFIYSQQDANIVAKEIKGIFLASFVFGDAQARNLTNGQEIDKVVDDNMHWKLETVFQGFCPKQISGGSNIIL